MTQSKTKGGSKHKGASTGKTRFQTVNTVIKARDSLSGKLEEYNRNYVVRPLKSTQTLVDKLKGAPRETIASLYKHGKGYIADLNKDARSTGERVVKEGKALLAKAAKDRRAAFDELVEVGKGRVDGFRHVTGGKIENFVVDCKSFLKGVENDTRLLMDEVLDGGRKALDKLPVKQRIEKEISSRMKMIPVQLNLPSKKDIEGLALQVRNLNAKVDELSKTVAA